MRLRLVRQPTPPQHHLSSFVSPHEGRPLGAPPPPLRPVVGRRGRGGRDATPRQRQRQARALDVLGGHSPSPHGDGRKRARTHHAPAAVSDGMEIMIATDAEGGKSAKSSNDSAKAGAKPIASIKSIESAKSAKSVKSSKSTK